MELQCGPSAKARRKGKHWLVFKEEQKDGQYRLNRCCICGGSIPSGPRLGCTECEDSYHEECAYRALKYKEIILHPFHRKHFLTLCRGPYYGPSELVCNFCGQAFQLPLYFYCVLCEFSLHFRCAMLPEVIAGNFVEIHREDHVHPLVLIDNNSYELKQAVCYCCWEPLVDSILVCVECKFYLHMNCVSPATINHPCHRRHSLILHVTTAPEPVSCRVCQRTESRQLFYRCSPCNFDLHTECVSPSPVIDSASHEHPFTFLLRQQSFICDACGTQGDCAPYHCHTCNLVLHKECISLPRTFKITRHHHLLHHTYFLEENELRRWEYFLEINEFKKWECKICHKEVNAEHGSYRCSLCDYVVHVNCAKDDADSDVDSDDLITTRCKDKKPFRT